jgi:transglutaminase-like putative cysteine protease
MSTIAEPLSAYVSPCPVVNFDDPYVCETAFELRGCSDLETAERCFCFVRDEIRHSSDCQINPVTLRASDVVRHRTGFCYAKSHLLAALLRANAIPAGLCYQRLTVDSDMGTFCLHGLNAMYLDGIGWYRIDARGNRDNMNAQFCPPHERLAFAANLPGEYTLPEIYVRPLDNVVRCLERCKTWIEVCESLPDAPP